MNTPTRGLPTCSSCGLVNLQMPPLPVVVCFPFSFPHLHLLHLHYPIHFVIPYLHPLYPSLLPLFLFLLFPGNEWCHKVCQLTLFKVVERSHEHSMLWTAVHLLPATNFRTVIPIATWNNIYNGKINVFMSTWTDEKFLSIVFTKMPFLDFWTSDLLDQWTVTILYCILQAFVMIFMTVIVTWFHWHVYIA